MTFKSTIDERDAVTATLAVATAQRDEPRVVASRVKRRDENQSIMARRREIKYLVDRATRTALTLDLKKFMQPDGFAGADGSYRVRSIYFDTPDFKAYHDKLAGAAVRHKLRMRAYGEHPSQTAGVRLEVKSRYLTVIHKSTADISWKDYGLLAQAIERRVLPPARLLGSGTGCMEFFRIRHQLNMEPKILIQYRRQAFERTEIHRLRVNFDDELWASRHLDLTGQLQGARRVLQYGHSIFELKVDGPLPYWMHTLISKYNLSDQSVSKYCHAVRSQARFSSVARVQDDR